GAEQITANTPLSDAFTSRTGRITGGVIPNIQIKRHPPIYMGSAFSLSPIML
ncbi:MAG: hypothetical protein K0R75_1554, partial [Paenibacillaceae bacterium]|nr:hypothetical protein [Paenibacillaceae bacterium]